MRFFYFLVVSLALLTGCNAIYQTSYLYQSPMSSSGKMCISQCAKIKNSCEHSYRKQYRNCRMIAHQAAYDQFQSYMNRQKRLHKPIEKSVNDFDNSYYQCNVSGECMSDFNKCYQSCGGTVIVKDQRVD